jgi:nucleoside-diphosphate-sugar epimerase
MLKHSTSGITAPTRVVIVGAGGFVGANLTKRLFDEGIAILPLGRKDIDLTEPNAGEKLSELLLPNDTLVLLSVIPPNKGRDNSVFMSNLKIGQAMGVAVATVRPRHLIYASSDAVYPFVDTVISENSAAAPTDLYGLMHRARELMLAQSAVPLAILRFTAIYGAGDTHASYGPNRFVLQALTEKKVSIIGNGEESRDHLYIADAVEIVRRVIARSSTGLLNVASGHSITFRNLAELIAAKRPSVRIERLPRKLEVTHRQFDISNIVCAFPDARFTSLSDGLQKTLLASDGTDPVMDLCEVRSKHQNVDN